MNKLKWLYIKRTFFLWGSRILLLLGVIALISFLIYGFKNTPNESEANIIGSIIVSCFFFVPAWKLMQKGMDVEDEIIHLEGMKSLTENSMLDK